MDHSPRITVRLPQTWLNRLDSLRGSENLAVFVRSIIYASLGDSVPAYKERRGTTWDRIVVMNRANKTAELRRRARNEKRRQQPKRPKPLPPPPVFVFHDNGIVGSPDLDIQATFCGLVREDGKYQAETTRYSEGMIREAVREALSTGSLSGERWRRFVARGERG